MDRFIINYNGNKYNEVKKYLKTDVETMDYDFIAEPFCGIFGFSRYFYLLNGEKNKKTRFLLNDIETDLINFYKELKKDFDGTLKTIEDLMEEEDIKKADDNISKCETLQGSYILKKMSLFRAGLYVKHKLLKKIENFKKKKTEYQEFFKICEFYNMDYKDFIENVVKPKKKKTLIFYDPPYFNSNNWLSLRPVAEE